MTTRIIERNSRISLQKILHEAGITDEFLEATYTDGFVILKPFKLRCVACGCTDEKKLKLHTGGILLCESCIEKDTVSIRKEDFLIERKD
jgi:late competence protein required for DNA uptake (superfamily II DNA/RNA helicase)